MARICGKPTADGTPCQRPPGCRIRHKRCRAVNRAPEIAAAVINDEFTLDDYAATTATDVFVPLKQEGLVVETRGVENISVETIMALLNDPAIDGLTISPKTTDTGDLITATHGIAVALPGSDLRFEIDTEPPSQTSHTYQSSKTGEHDRARAPENITTLTSDIDAFLRHMQPVTDTEAAWIGLWKDAGIIELNVTVVINETHEQEAITIGQRWNQKAVFHLGRGEEIETGGTGGTSIYSSRGSRSETGLRSRLRRWATNNRDQTL